MAPADENECRQMLYTATTLDGPAAVRYPARHAAPACRIVDEMSALPIGRAELRRRGGSGLALLAFGTMLAPALALGERLDATVVNMRFVKPLDATMLLRDRRHPCRHSSRWRRMSWPAVRAAPVPSCCDAAGLSTPRLHVGIPDRFIEHGSREDCLREAGLDVAGIAATIERWCGADTRLEAGPCRPQVGSGGIGRRRPDWLSRAQVKSMNTATRAPNVICRRGRAVPRRHPAHSDQSRRHQGHPPPGAGQGPLARRAAHRRDASTCT